MSLAIAGDLSGIMPDPERTFRILVEGGDPAVGQARSAARIIGEKTFTIKTGQPGQGPDPNVAIASLRDGGDGVLRQAILGLPDANGITFMGDVAHGPCGKRARTGGQEQHYNSDPTA